MELDIQMFYHLLFHVKYTKLYQHNLSDIHLYILNVLVIYLEDLDVRAAANIEMSGITPQFHRKIYSYAVMVSKQCEIIEFGITPMDNVRNISADTIVNGSVQVNRITDEDNDELLKQEQSANNIDISVRNENVLKSDEEIEEEVNAMIDDENQKNQQGMDPRLGMDNLYGAETQSFSLDPPGTSTRFTIESGSSIKYQVLVIRAEEIFGIPKYQIFNPQELPPCPKQKRIFIVMYFVFIRCTCS